MHCECCKHRQCTRFEPRKAPPHDCTIRSRAGSGGRYSRTAQRCACCDEPTICCSAPATGTVSACHSRDPARCAWHRIETVRSWELHSGEHLHPSARIAAPRAKYGVPAHDARFHSARSILNRSWARLLVLMYVKQREPSTTNSPNTSGQFPNSGLLEKSAILRTLNRSVTALGFGQSPVFGLPPFRAEGCPQWSSVYC